MSSVFGNKVRVQVFGQSHSEALGVVIDGLPPGELLDMDRIAAFLECRRGGKAFTTKRAEADVPRVVSGLVDGRTCGAPLCAMFGNTDARSADYSQAVPRPSHADYNAYVKYNGFADYRGGGHFSGRMTLPLCFAGAVCMQLLERRGIGIYAHIASIGGVTDRCYDPMDIARHELTEFCVLDAAAREAMQKAIADAAEAGDSLGGTVECAITGVPIGTGEPMFDGIENRLAAAIFGIPAVKGIEFGAGFAAARMRGSEHNDGYYYEDGAVKHSGNNAGGIIGGIATGQPIVFRVAIKPTPSIAREQQSVDLEQKTGVSLRIAGRHDPCIVPRAVPCVAAVAAVVMMDMAEV